MNKRKALEATRDLWIWLALNPTQEKGDWPGWRTFSRGDYFCPLCNYAIEKSGFTRPPLTSRCPHCPLYDKWVSTEVEDAPCTDEDSPYALWENSEDLPGVRTATALELVRLCVEALQDLYEEEEEEEEENPLKCPTCGRKNQRRKDDR